MFESECLMKKKTIISVILGIFIIASITGYYFYNTGINYKITIIEKFWRRTRGTIP